MTAEVTWDDCESPAPPFPGWMRQGEGQSYERQVAEQFRTAMSVTGAAIFGAVYKVTGPVAWVPVPAAAIFLIGLATRRTAVARESAPDLMPEGIARES